MDRGISRCIKTSAGMGGTMRSQRLAVLAQLTGSTQFKLGLDGGFHEECFLSEEIPNKTALLDRCNVVC